MYEETKQQLTKEAAHEEISFTEEAADQHWSKEAAALQSEDEIGIVEDINLEDVNGVENHMKLQKKEDIQKWTYENLVPEALLGLRNLMLHAKDPKIRKSAIDKVFELAGVSGEKHNSPSVGFNLNLDPSFFNAAQEGMKKVTDAVSGGAYDEE
jgi:hypothetical protein